MPIRVDIAAAVGAGEQPGASAQGDHAFILPISGRIASSTIAGMHCSVAESALKGVEQRADTSVALVEVQPGLIIKIPVWIIESLRSRAPKHARTFPQIPFRMHSELNR